MIKQLNVSLQWETIVASDQATWPFTSAKRIDPALECNLRGAKIYRFVFCKPQKQCAYIGEAGNFIERFAKYRGAWRECNKCEATLSGVTAASLEEGLKDLNRKSTVRVGTNIVSSRVAEIVVKLQALRFEDFTFNGVDMSQDMLDNPFIRRAIENLAILDTQANGIEIMNSGQSSTLRPWVAKRKKHARDSNVAAKAPLVNNVQGHNK